MKHYPKINDNICSIDKWPMYQKRIESVDGSLDELVLKYRSFFREAHLSIFNAIIKTVWLDQQLIFSGKRRTKRMGNGQWRDISFGRFFKVAVGISQRVLTANLCFTPVATYLIDFFPDFLINDPFKDPEKYLYPYKHVTLDFLIFVYQMDNRLEILDEAEKKCMSYGEFINWVTNWVLCYNLEVGRTDYELVGGVWVWLHVRNNKLKKYWENNKFKFKK